MPNYEKGQAPLHPVTGEPAAYYFEIQFGKDAGKRVPRWGKKPKDPLTKDPAGTWYTTPEVARLIGVSVQLVSRAIREKRLHGTKGPATNGTGGKRGRWFINGADVLRFVGADPNLAARAAGYGK